MPTFDTPEPISVVLEFDLGAARITAGKRVDTVVEVLPANAAADIDVRAAEQTKVVFSGGTLSVKGPKKRSLFGKCGALHLSIELPAGSHLRGTSPMADFLCEGRFGECRIKTSMGDIRIDEATAANLKTGWGDIRVDRVTGDAEVYGAGRIEVGEITGTAVVKNGNGETSIGSVTGDLRANSSNGRISVDVAHASVNAKSANGSLRVGNVTRGQVTLHTAAGDVEVGINESTAAWLDVHTGAGGVHNDLDPSDSPGTAEETVEVRARTGVGDIVIRRP
ncbi:DUF4097 family beta strand repeat-containing protein [Streptomyces sp. NPDC046261]|uniref:DUF4097 family beta strand repeat-containing protein n=1 Tax=Streptomyces sp. NPDC046261 TaxID=3157200 RepID=UPI0033E91609